jgi:hypothetical protein
MNYAIGRLLAVARLRRFDSTKFELKLNTDSRIRNTSAKDSIAMFDTVSGIDLDIE